MPNALWRDSKSLSKARKETGLTSGYAFERRTLDNQLTLKEKIAQIDARLGKGKGAVKERKRLQEKV